MDMLKLFDFRSQLAGTSLFRGLLAAAMGFVLTTGFTLAQKEDVKQGAPAVRRVLVAPFENNSGHSKEERIQVSPDPNNPRYIVVDLYMQAPRTALEDVLVNISDETFEVIERQKVDQMLQEQQFGSLSGMVDESTAARLGNVLGANTMVVGSISQIKLTKKEFEGYGIKRVVVTASCELFVRCVDIQSMKVLASGRYKGTKEFQATDFGSENDSDWPMTVLERAIDSLRADKDFHLKLKGKREVPKAQEVEVEFSPTPQKCDVFINDEYMGSSPVKLKLPVGAPVQVEIKKAGFAPWKVKLTPKVDMSPVSPELEKASKTDGN